jgi:tellurite resistance protein TehA-like permease
MGTGIVSILLHNLPYNARWLYWISIVIFCLNIFLFILFTGISIVRYTVFRGVWSAMLKHPVQSLFLGGSFYFKLIGIIVANGRT